MAEHEFPEKESLRKKNIVLALDQVSAKLGNTRAICKKSYVYPALLEAYETGELLPYLKKISKSQNIIGEKGLNHDEKMLLSFLKAQRMKKIGSK